LIAPLALAVVLLLFGALSPVFLTGDNLLAVLAQSALLGIVAMGLTFAVRAGGIDLSVGVALDLGALGASGLISDGWVPWVAVAGGLFLGLLVGLVNAFLVVVARIPPFLATLGVWFIGTSVQQLMTSGGAPIYLSASRVPDGFAVLGRGRVLGVDSAVFFLLVVVVVAALLLGATRWGRRLTLSGEQARAARLVGLHVKRLTVSAYVLSALVAAFAGVLLASRSNGFVPGSGQGYLLDAIGAVFIGSTLSRHGRASPAGTLVGVVLFGLLGNGMNLMGLSFFWQGLGRGVILLLVLLLGVLLSRSRKPRAASLPPGMVGGLAALAPGKATSETGGERAASGTEHTAPAIDHDDAAPRQEVPTA